MRGKGRARKRKRRKDSRIRNSRKLREGREG